MYILLYLYDLLKFLFAIELYKGFFARWIIFYNLLVANDTKIKNIFIFVPELLNFQLDCVYFIIYNYFVMNINNNLQVVLKILQSTLASRYSNQFILVFQL